MNPHNLNHAKRYLGQLGSQTGLNVIENDIENVIENVIERKFRGGGVRGEQL